VSEFIAIAPPNHGVRVLTFDPTPRLSAKQLFNGYTPAICARYAETEARDFIEKLNGHPMADTHASAPAPATFDSEAPGQRANGTPPTDGVLYVTLYADGDRDLVGGDTRQDDCTWTDFFTGATRQQGRSLARNLATHAVNLPLAEIEGADVAEVHRNTVHHPRVMCLALLTAVTHRVPPTTTTCPEQNGVPTVPLPPRATVALVLDLSGSMLSAACPGCTASRLQVLQESAQLFVQLWALVGAPQDAIGVTYFRTDITTLPLPPNNAVLAPLGTSVETILTDFQNLQTTPASLTAMGGGLQSAITALIGASDARHIVLFTDGMQNVFPKVVATGGHLEIAGTGTPQSNVVATSPPTRLDQNLGIKVSVIGVGAGEAFVGLLQDIATATGGLTRFTTAPDEDLRRFFIEQLINALRGFSPQLLGYRRATLRAATAREAFTVNANVRKLVLKLSWQAPRKLSFRVERNGVDVTGAGTIVDGPFYRFVTFHPAKVAALRAGGTWTMRVEGAAGDGYEAAAIVDEPTVRVEPSLGPTSPRVGDALELVLRLGADGKAVTRAKVEATVWVPRQGVGTLLATTPANAAAQAARTEPGLTAVQRRADALLLEKTARAALRAVGHRVALSERGDGVYRASFTGVTVPGVYTVVFQVEGRLPKGGVIQRTETQSMLVRFGRADAKVSALSLETLGTNGPQRELAIHVRPRDARGNFLGPGAASEIQVALTEGTAAKGIVDFDNGGYILPIVTRAADPTVTLTVAGTVLYRGTLSGLPAPRTASSRKP
jgi:hypothetical protein